MCLWLVVVVVESVLVCILLMPFLGQLTVFVNRSVVILRMRFLLKIVLLFCLLTVVYQYSHCTRLPNPYHVKGNHPLRLSSMI